MIMWLLVFLLLFAVANSASSINSKNYMTIEKGFKFCFLRLNATHSVGCSTSPSGNVGIVYLMRTDEEAKKFKDVADAQYVLLMSMMNFADRQLMESLNQDKRVAGVVLFEPLKLSDRPNKFSVDSRCPNAKHSVYGPQKQCSIVDWNAAGTDYYYTKWNFPIVYFTDTLNASVNRIMKCAENFNSGQTKDERRCAMEIKTTMFAVKDSRVCLRRTALNALIIKLNNFCDPVNGNNFHYVFAPEIANTDRNTIVVTARLDSLSLFTDSGFGSYAVYPSVSMLVALAETFAKLSSGKIPKKRVIFTLLDGESTQYMGSNRLIYDMQQHTFMKAQLGNATELRHIHSVLELGQLGAGAHDGTFFVHTSKNSKTGSLDRAWVDKLKQSAVTEGVNLQPKNASVLPPSSAQIFLKGSNDISAVLLSDYQASYRNPLFHSLYDDEKSIAAKNLTKLIKVVFTALYREVFEENPTSNVNEEKVEEIISCFYNASKCQLFKEASYGSLGLSNETILDASIGPFYRSKTLANLANKLLFYMTGENFTSLTTSTACQAQKDKKFPKRSYRWINGPDTNGSKSMCWRSLVATYTIKAPDIDEWLADWDTKTFAYWTESYWKQPSVRLFLAPSKRWETLVLCVGVILTLVTIVVVVLMDKYIENIFPGVFYVSGSNPSS